MIMVSSVGAQLARLGSLADPHTDSVIWFGDFNYRIGLSYDRAHELVRNKDLERLYENDQVRVKPKPSL